MNLKSYNDKGLSAILTGAAELVTRAAHAYHKMGDFNTPGEVKGALKKEADLCLAEAEELLAGVRNARATTKGGE